MGSPDQAAHEIVASRSLLAEARAILPDLKRVATMKAGEDGVRKVVAKRFETYPQPQRTDAQWAAWWADYFDVLADCTLASLEAGMRAYVADPSSEFMPKPGKLRELAEKSPSRSLQRYYRAKRAIDIADTPAVTTTFKPADPAEVKAMLAEFQAVTAKPITQPPPSIAGKPDERGITQAMRDLIARRGEARP